jgi:plastocyanin
MKRRIALVLLLIVLAFIAASCMVSNPSPGTSSTTTAAQDTTGTSASQGNTVSIANFAFDPETLTVPAGTTVIWTNNDTTTHTIKSSDFNSGNLANGETYEHKFDTKGRFDYSCGIHPTMKGTIIVD